MNALLVSALFGVVLMFASFLLQSKSTLRLLATVGMGALLVLNLAELQGWTLISLNTEGMLRFDRYSLVFNTVILFAVLIYLLLSGKEMEKVGNYQGDYLALLFFITAGMMMVTAFESLLILFLGIEIISIPLYILTGSDKRNLKSNEASLKYFLLGSFSTGLFLMGVALVYGAKGSFATGAVVDAAKVSGALLLAGLLIIFFAMSFKVSAVPFHFWTPDVYDGAPTVFTSFMATVVKVSVFAAFIRLFEGTFAAQQGSWQLWIAVITALTLLVGNLTAVFQQSVKRMLAYSSIAQAGFMFLALYALNTVAKEGLILYAASYSIATIGIFSVLSKVNDYTYEGFNGLAKKEPLVAGALTIFFLSLAGIPLTGGFLAKLFMIKAALTFNLYLAIFAVLMAAVSVYYYFRVIQAMYFRPAQEEAQTTTFPAVFKIILLAAAAILIVLGLFPEALLSVFYFQ
jgi:NADH-quinone oxidoreductase subunit N